MEENIKKLEEHLLQNYTSQTHVQKNNMMIEVRKYMLKHSRFVLVQEVGQFISDTKKDLGSNKKKSKRRPMSFDIFKKIQPHLNAVQIYV